MRCAAWTGIGLLRRARLVVDGRRGRVGPVVAARYRHAAVERADVPVDARDPIAAVLAPDGDLPAMILGSLRRVQRPPQRGIVQEIDLAMDRARAAGIGHRAGVRAEIQDPPGHPPAPEIGGAALEEAIQAEAPPPRTVGAEEIARHRRAPRTPGRSGPSPPAPPR